LNRNSASIASQPENIAALIVENPAAAAAKERLEFSIRAQLALTDGAFKRLRGLASERARAATSSAAAALVAAKGACYADAAAENALAAALILSRAASDARIRREYKSWHTDPSVRLSKMQSSPETIVNPDSTNNRCKWETCSAAQLAVALRKIADSATDDEIMQLDELLPPSSDISSLTLRGSANGQSLTSYTLKHEPHPPDGPPPPLSNILGDICLDLEPPPPPPTAPPPFPLPSVDPTGVGPAQMDQGEKVAEPTANDALLGENPGQETIVIKGFEIPVMHIEGSAS
jgi:hypothetical protein